MNLEKAISLQDNKDDFFVVGGSSNLNDYEDLLEFKILHNNSYSLATKDELGFRYRTDFADNFTFIGKNNRIVGTLNDDASIDDIDIMIKRALASFYGLAVKNDSDKLLLTEEQTTLNIADYFRADDHSIIDYEIKNNTNPNIVEAIISEGELILWKTAVNGVSDLSIIARIHGRDIYVQTDLKIINPTSVYEDFEIAKLEDSIIRWTQSGNADWFVTEDESYFGSKSLRSGEINGGETSAISVELNLTEPGVVVFAYKTSTRPFYNKFAFFIDSLNLSEKESPDLWSGENEWRLLSYSVRSGPRTLKWEYTKSLYDPLDYLDRTWIDLVVIPDRFDPPSDIFDRSKLIKELSVNAHPNPFNPSTEISFTLNKNYQTELLIFDMKGRLVSEIFKGKLEKGNHSFNFDGSRLSSGIYYSVLRYGNKIVTNKMILAK